VINIPFLFKKSVFSSRQTVTNHQLLWPITSLQSVMKKKKISNFKLKALKKRLWLKIEVFKPERFSATLNPKGHVLDAKMRMCSFDWQGSRSKQDRSSAIWAEITKHVCKLVQILRLLVINFSTFFRRVPEKTNKVDIFACEWEILKKDHHQGKQCILVSFHWNGHT